MLRSTFYSFTTALRGLNTAQKQLDITGQNISNVSTTGYTRQRADVYSAVPAGYGDKYATRTATTAGQGVVIGSISQCRDQFLDVRFRREAANLGEEDAKLDTMQDLSLIFDEIENKGLMTSFNDFVSKLQTLANNAESSEFDSIAKDSATTLIKQFNQYASQISTVREEKEYNLKEVTGKALNDLMTNISGLNKSIREVQSNGGPALELKDERNLLLDQLSSYVKLDVKYDPKEIAGGIVVDDVTISMVGKDGEKEPLIFNDTAATFNVKTAGEDGTDKSIVTIDNSALPAKQALSTIDNLLKTISMGNSTLQSINNELAKLYPGDPNMLPPKSAYKELPNKISEITDSIEAAGGLNEQIVTATTNEDDARKALTDKLADTVTPPTAAEIEVLNKTLIDAMKAKNTLVAQRTTAIEEREMLIDYNTPATTFATSITNCDTSLKSTLSKYGITATQMWTEGDYTSCYYTFKNTSGATIQDADGKDINWKVGNSYTQLDRDGLSELGIVFTNQFDAEEFASAGALKGSIDMINSQGIFDYEANNIRGIGYYENMLDSLADKLATTLNSINDRTETPDIEALFQTSDGSSKFTASNLRIADDWLNGKYGITGTKHILAGDNSAQNDNILLMISTISSKMTYSTGAIPNKDANGNYLKTAPDGSTSIAADGKDLNGNYTLKKNSDGTINDPPLLVANKDFVNYIDDGFGNMILDTTTESKLDSRSESFLYNGTFQEFLSNTSNVLSLDISSTSNLAANHDTILKSIQTSKDSISSVSLDEEGVNIMQFQKAYNAAARLMTALDEAVERIINQMGTVGR